MKRISIFFVLFCSTIIVGLQAQTVTINSIENITPTTVKVKGEIANLGSRVAEIKRRGFFIAPLNNPTAGDTIRYDTVAPKKNETYSYELYKYEDYLNPNTDYWVQAFITFKKTGQDTEYVYSIKDTFTTAAPINDYSSTGYVDNLSLTTATLKGSIDSMGNASVLHDVGFVYSKTSNPTLNAPGAEYTRSTFNSNKVYPKAISSDLINLDASTMYYYRVWVINKYNENYYDTTYSTQKSFTTLHACNNVPIGLDTVYVHTDEVELTWQAGEGQTLFQVEYGFSGHTVGEGDTITVEGTSVVLSDLESNRSYTSYVRAVCPDMNSEWSNMRPFHTRAALCEKVMGLHLDNATHVTAKLEWTPGKDGDNQWEVLFATKNQSYGGTPFVVKDYPIFAPAGLSENTEYKIKVRTVCTITYETTEIDPNTGDEVVVTKDSVARSLWSEDYEFITAKSALTEGEEINYYVSVFPNPASDVINFSMQGDRRRITKTEIYSTLGTLVYSSDTMPEQLDVSNFESGTYIIHITSSKGTQVEKIFIK